MTMILIAKVTLLLAAAGFGVWLLRRSTAAARHMVGVVGLGAALALPVLAIALPAWNVSVPALPPHSPAIDRSPVSAPALAPAPQEALRPAVPAELMASLPADSQSESAAMPVSLNGGSNHHLNRSVPAVGFGQRVFRAASSVPVGGWLALWIVGLAWILGRLVMGWMRMTQLSIDARPLDSEPTWELLETCREELNLKATPSVLVSTKLRVPVLWGFVKPVLLLPVEAERWPTDRLRVVLLHELAHMKRRDGLSLLVGRIAAALWWFHPMVWLLERRVRRECETACDDLVLATGERPSNYASHLVAIAGKLTAIQPEPVGALSILGRGDLEHRVQAILNSGPRNGFGGMRAAVMLSFCAVTLLSIASARLVTQAAVSPSTPDERVISSVSYMPGGTATDCDEPDCATTIEAHALPNRDHRTEWSVQYASGELREPQEVLLAQGSKSSREGAEAFKRAMQLHNEERWAEASERFQEAANAGYNVGTSSYNAACGLARMGDGAGTVEWLEKAMEEDFDVVDYIRRDNDLDPVRRDPVFVAFVESLEQQGVLRGGDRRYRKTLESYDRLLKRNSTVPDEWYETGSELLSMREFEKAKDALQRAAELEPDSNANAHYNLACAYSLAGDSRAALDELEKAVLQGFGSEERFEQDSDLDNIRDSDRFNEIDALRETLSLDRFRRNSWFGSGRSEYSPSRWEPAVKEFQEFVKESPKVGRAWSNLGWALHHSRRFSEARNAFQRQLDLGYKTGTATYNIACTHAMEGNSDEAMNWLERSVADGFASAGQILGDDDLDSLRDHDRFRDLIESAGGTDSWFGKKGWSLDRLIDHFRYGHDDDEDQDDHDHQERYRVHADDVVY